MATESVKKVPAKRIVVKLGAPEEAEKFQVGDCTIVTVDRASGEVTLLISDKSPAWNHPRAYQQDGDYLFRAE